MIESSAHKQARRLAQKLVAGAAENEPQITADLQKIISEISAEIIGLENKFKTKESLTRKLLNKSYGDPRKLQKAADRINDVLRYTFVLPFETYADGVRRTIESLRESGYRVPENEIWNAWKSIGTGKDRGYRGINITVISSENQKFELQFHTKESFRLKTETHDLYKEARLAKTSTERREEIKNSVLEKAADVGIPKGVKKWNM